MYIVYGFNRERLIFIESFVTFEFAKVKGFLWSHLYDRTEIHCAGEIIWSSKPKTKIHDWMTEGF